MELETLLSSVPFSILNKHLHFDRKLLCVT